MKTKGREEKQERLEKKQRRKQMKRIEENKNVNTDLILYVISGGRLSGSRL